MKLNNEYNFGVVPTVRTPRSRFLTFKNLRTTFNAAQLIPIYVNPLIQPGDTLKVKSTMVIRMSTPIHPTMDNLFADLRAFFVPHRIVWDHFKEFMGENSTGAWTQTTTYTVPQLAIYNDYAARKIAIGDSLQYMGIPIGYPKAITTAPTVANCTTTVMSLPWRAYAKTWNDWYRDENVTPPFNLYTGDNTKPVTRGSTTYIWGVYNNSQDAVPLECAPVYKFKDYFNACLPEPQKGPAVTLPIGSSAPVIGNGMALGFDTGSTTPGYEHLGLKIGDGITSPTLTATTGNYGATVGAASTGNGSSEGLVGGVTTDATKSGLITDLSNAVAATINAQRVAFAVQRIEELSARAGTRFPEIIDAFFGVKGLMSAVVQRPQYLGGFRLPLQMNQVLQTSSTDNTSPQGNTAAYSLTVDSQQFFTHSFEEWGTLLFCLCVRQEHSYSQGIENFWSKKNKLDFYWPQLAFLGEQPILTKEIYADGSSNDDSVFGYNERWIEYRTERNLNTGAFSPDYSASLDVWHYGDDYSQAPVLSDAWRRETKDYIDRTLAVQSNVEPQFLMDSRFEFDKTTCMPLRSIPGLLDHF